MTARALFALVAGMALFLLLVLVVLRPAVERGGWGELVLVLVALVAILLVERWMRSR